MQVRITRSLALALASLVSLAGLWTAAATASATAPDYLPGEVIVKFKAGTEAQERQAALATLDADAAERIGTPRTRVIELDDSVSVSEAITELEARPEVAWAEPNYIGQALNVPDDPRFADGSLWGLRNTGQTVEQDLGGGTWDDRAGVEGMDINAVEAWSTTTGDPDVNIGVIDSGVFLHEDLRANLRSELSRDFTAPTGVPENPFADAVGHGTHVAGTIGAVGDNGLGVTGVNWDVGMVAIRVMAAAAGVPSSDIAKGMAYAGQLGLPVVNMSLGVQQPSQAIADAVRLAPGTLVVAAAGNDAADNDGTVNIPCTLPYENVICVAAIGNIGELAPFSNFGSSTVDIGAPGNEILSTVPAYQEPVELPIHEDSITDGDWTTGPQGEEWIVRDVEGPEGDQIPALASNEPEELQGGLDSHVTSMALDLTGQAGCSWKGLYQLDIPQPSSPADMRGILIFERAVGPLWQQLGVKAAPTERDGFSFALQADGLPGITVRVRLVTAEEIEGEFDGAVIEDTFIECLDQDVDDEYDLKSGTSMAAPHVAGVAGLLLARNPELATGELREAILSTGRATNSLQGRTVTGTRVDAAAALASVEPPEPPVPPQLRAGIWPGQMPLLRHRGLVFGATANHSAAITARAVVRWRGANVRRGDRVLRIRPGAVRLRHLTVGRPAPWNPRARMVEPGRISPMLLRPTRRQLRHLVRVQRLTGQPLRVNLATRAFAPETNPWPVMFRDYRLR